MHRLLPLRDLAWPPSADRGHCQTWGGIRIDQGRFGTTDLSGINVGLMIEIPGMMSRGNWTAAVYVDKRAKAAQLKR